MQMQRGQRIVEAVRLFEKGHLAAAEQTCRELLNRQPLSTDALNLLAVILCQQGDYDNSRSLLRQVLLNDPTSRQALETLGDLCEARFEFVEASDVFRFACLCHPDEVRLVLKLCLSFAHAGRASEAEKVCLDELQRRPNCQDLHCVHGRVLFEIGRYKDAATAFWTALSYQPDSITLLRQVGLALLKAGLFGEGFDVYRQVMAVTPSDADDILAEAHFVKGTVLLEQKEIAAAVEATEACLALRPDHAGAICNLGVASSMTPDSIDHAISCYRDAISLDPQNTIAWVNLAKALHTKDDFVGATDGFARALSISPHHSDGLSSFGNLKSDMGLLDEARCLQEEAVRCDPTQARARYHRSLSMLMDGDLSQGFAEFEWRKKVLPVTTVDRPEWKGEPLEGRTILLHREQGLGDTIQFVRFARSFEARGASVILLVQPPLASLFRSSFPAAKVATDPDSLPVCDYHLSLLSTPFRLGINLETIPSETPYLTVDSAIAETWLARLADLTKLKVGLVWAGNPQHTFDRRRSVSLATLLKHLPRDGVTLFSLQKELQVNDSEIIADESNAIVDLSGMLNNFTDTAAAIQALDLVISVDSSVAHLAGALGRPCWVLLPYALDWRWLRHRTDSPWYPSLRLFRQSRAGEWSDVFVRLAKELEGHAHAWAGVRATTCPAAL